MAPIALLAAAAFFTFGAALGVTAGWGAIVSGAMAKVGLSGTLASVVGGAVAQAGYGALSGGVLGAVTGKGLLKGAQQGALAGAITGGVAGGFGFGPGTATGSPTSSGLMPPSAPPIIGPQPLGPQGLLGKIGGVVKGFAKGADKALAKHSGLLGPIIAGLGSGVSRDADLKAMEARQERVSGSYDIDWDAAQAGYGEQSEGGMMQRAPTKAPPPKKTLYDAQDRILREL